MKDKKAQSCGCAPYVGSGTLSDYKKDGSWMMNQMEKGYDKVQRGVTVDKSGDYIKFAKKQNKIASKLITSSADYNISKYYKLLQSDDKGSLFVLRFCLTGTINGITLRQINLINELIMTKYFDDVQSLRFVLNFDSQNNGGTRIDFSKSSIVFEPIIYFYETSDKVIDCLNKIGFESIQE